MMIALAEGIGCGVACEADWGGGGLASSSGVSVLSCVILMSRLISSSGSSSTLSILGTRFKSATKILGLYSHEHRVGRSVTVFI